MDPRSLRMSAQMSLANMVANIEEMVSCESPSSDLSAIANSGEVVARVGKRLLGVAPERIILEGVTHLRWRLGHEPARVLILGHHDTVWPLGSLAILPFSAVDGVLRGPGCFDMKAGLAMALHAASMLDDTSGVTILVTGDEELGSPTSRSLIESEASGCEAVLVLEASADGGALKVARKGVSRYDVRVRGRASHAGLDPEQGVNATIELAQQVIAVAGLADRRLGTTVTPTTVTSGTTTNTVPAVGDFAVDVRVCDDQEQGRVHRAMMALRPTLAEAQVRVTGGTNRPPFTHASSGALFARAARLAENLGIGPLSAASVGGASDGNFTAGLGIATLDGLGAVGGGAHAEHEHVQIDELPARTALLAALIDDILGDSQPSSTTSESTTIGATRP